MFSRTSVRFLLMPCLALLAVATTYFQTAAGGNLRAGAAKLDITPKISDLLTPTDVIRDHLFARAIVVDNGSTCAVLIGFDLSNANDDRSIVNGISRAAASIGCPAQNFIVSYTHTHSSSTQGLQVGPPSSKQQEDIIVAVANAAKAKLAPARVGYGTTTLDLNTNRDLPSLKPEARSASNPEYPSDKTLAVVEFIGADNVPIGVYMNYGMHPTAFYQAGVLSADFPGEASQYLEKLFDGRAVAIYSQAAEGDQGSGFDERAVSRVLNGEGLVEKFGVPAATARSPAARARSPASTSRPRAPDTAPDDRLPVPTEKMADYKRGIELTGANITMIGAFIGANTVRVMREIQPIDTAQIRGARETITCPGRDRDLGKPPRENGFPEYEDGPDVNIRVGALRIGDIHFVTVNGEIYSEIGMRIKAASPATKTLVVAMANGRANSGYIYADDASSHLVFEVLGSRIKPGCAQGKIVSTAVDLLRQPGK